MRLGVADFTFLLSMMDELVSIRCSVALVILHQSYRQCLLALTTITPGMTGYLCYIREHEMRLGVAYFTFLLSMSDELVSWYCRVA